MAMIGHRLAEGLAMMKEDRERGTGRTTEQLKAAPACAIYLWPVQQSVGYVRHLAHQLGRDDLEIRHIRALDEPQRFQGLRRLNIVVDHACYDVPGAMTDRRAAALEKLKPLMGRG
jgi:hypothetical protein